MANATAGRKIDVGAIDAHFALYLNPEIVSESMPDGGIALSFGRDGRREGMVCTMTPGEAERLADALRSMVDAGPVEGL